MIILQSHIGVSCKVNVMFLAKSTSIPPDIKFPFKIIGVEKNNRALICLWNNPETIFSVAGFNICINKGEHRNKLVGGNNYLHI